VGASEVPANLAAAMPLTFTGTRSVSFRSLAEFSPLVPLMNSPGDFVQAVGTIKNDGTARAVAGTSAGEFAAHPLAATGLYGRGAVTVLTFDAGIPELEARLAEKDWIGFWNLVAGWQSGQVKTAADVDAARLRGNVEPVTIPPREIRLGGSIATDVDVTQQTHTFIITAVLFLGLYWLVAGPVGHLILRYYRVVHWSWWIFGAVVVVATTLAGFVVFLLHITTYELRHKSFVLGTVDSPQVSVLGFYGVYAPASGEIEVKQPDEGGMNYLAPMCIPTTEEVKPFADPQSYDVSVEHPNAISPVFRNTLKKLEGRWTGELQTLVGQATATGDVEHPLAGELVNRSAYDLDNVQVVLYRSTGTRGNSLLYNVGTWKAGATLDLQKGLVQDRLEGLQVEDYLQVMGWHASRESIGGPLSGGGGPEGASAADKTLYSRVTSDDMLYFLLDQRRVDDLVDSAGGKHHEVIRGFARLTDVSKELHAAGAVILAHSGNIQARQFVQNPVPISVDGRDLAGKGEIRFVWALPVGQPARAAGESTQRGPGPGGAGAGTGPATSRPAISRPSRGPLIPLPEAP
jgi:hypothetical protein